MVEKSDVGGKQGLDARQTQSLTLTGTVSRKRMERDGGDKGKTEWKNHIKTS